MGGNKGTESSDFVPSSKTFTDRLQRIYII